VSLADDLDGLTVPTPPKKFQQHAEFDEKGGTAATGPVRRMVTDYRELLTLAGLDPDAFRIVGKVSQWTKTFHAKEDTYSFFFQFERCTAEEAEEFASILERIKGFTYIPTKKALNPESLIVMPTDLQVGKVDWNGGTEETVDQSLESFAKAAEFAREFRPAEICMVDAGDAIENIYSTSSQLGTNDRDLPGQIEIAHHIFLTGLQELAPLAPSIRYVAVSSNHGAQRLGQKAPAGDAHADYGLGIAKMIRRALQLNPNAYQHVTVQTPEPYMESLYFETSGSQIGVVHGHQAGSPDKLGEWWKGQSHGNMPVAKARILLAGHFHSLRYYQSGDARHVFVGPASDRGSSWFTNARGESSDSGMLTFTTSENQWDNLRVL
jgi:hypothetical protein